MSRLKKEAVKTRLSLHLSKCYIGEKFHVADQGYCITQRHSHKIIIGPRREKTCLRGFANNKGAVQPAHPRSLISAFLINFLESIIRYLVTGEISIF